MTAKKTLKQQRVIRYFIDAAEEISRTKGMNSITIREVADKAGYNSATLYNYFKDLNQLIAYTSIDLIIGCLIEQSISYRSLTNSLEIYIKNWKIYCEHAFNNPTIYSYIYNKSNTSYIFSHWNAYLDLFPEYESQIDSRLVSVYGKEKDLMKQDLLLMEDCIRDGYFLPKDIADVINVGDLLSDGFILKLMRQEKNQNSISRYIDDFMRYYMEYIKTKVLKEIPAFTEDVR